MWKRLGEAAGWSFRHRLRVAIPAVAAAAAFAVATWSAGASGWRLVWAALAFISVLVYGWTWQDDDEPTGGRLWQTLGLLLVIVLSSLAAVGAAVIAVATLVGSLFAARTDAFSVTAMNVGAYILAAIAAFVFAWWARSTARLSLGGVLILSGIVGIAGVVLSGLLAGILAVLATCAVAGFAHLAQRVGSKKASYFLSFLAGLAGAVALLYALDDRAVPRQQDFVAVQRARKAGLGLYDLVVVVDPADALSRRLIAAARDDPSGSMFRPEALNASYDVAYALAVARPPRRGRPLWKLVQPPTKDLAALAAALAKIEPRRGPPASGSYGRILSDTLTGAFDWRDATQRGVAFALDRLPSLDELNAGTSGRRDAIPTGRDPAFACEEFRRKGPIPELVPDPAVPVAWGDALAQHCERRTLSNLWEATGRPEGFRPVALHVLTGTTGDPHAAEWWTWAQALDGRLEPAETVPPRPNALIRDAVRMHTGQPFGRLEEVVDRFRPYLFFDEHKDHRPVDVDWLLTPTRSNPNYRGVCETPAVETGTCERVVNTHTNQVCDRTDGEPDCERIGSPADLTRERDEFIDLADVGRAVEGRTNDGAPGRMYVHVREEQGWLYLGYWWFFTFNTSPYRPEVNCLPGLGFKERSCFDHQGDWEGVTVVLRLKRRGVDELEPGNLAREAVHFDAHGHPVRWRWHDIERAAEDGDATHPVVYVATGSHASYPAPCREDECTQGLAGGALGEGGFDGKVPWPENDREVCLRRQRGSAGEDRGTCLVGLPSTRDGKFGVLWNAFPGAWGAAKCSSFGKLCSSGDGPKSPSRQTRFARPWEVAREGPIGTLARQRNHGTVTGLR